MREFAGVLVVYWIFCFNLLMFVSPLSYGSGDDDFADVGKSKSVDIDVGGGFYAWVSEREQVRDTRLIADVRVLVSPSHVAFPGITVDASAGDHKEVIVRVDVVPYGASVPSKYPHVFRERSRFERERSRGAEAVEFMRNVIFAADGDLFLENVRGDGSGRFEATVFVFVEGQKVSLASLLVGAEHAIDGDVRDWGARLVREVR